jgi:hypothetical protein
MSQHRHSALLLALPGLLLAAFAAPAWADQASGSVNVGGAAFKVTDAVAYPDDDEIEIVFSGQAFDREKMAEDGRIDTFDAMRHAGDTLTINLGADGPTMCVDVKHHEGETMYSGSTCNSAFTEAMSIRREGSRVVGSVQWGEAGGEHMHLRFDVAVAAAKPAN